MLALTNLSYYIGARPIYENANLHIKPKDKIGLIGPNGAGKSTLLRLIVGEYKPDGGEISKSSDCTLGFLNQDLLSYDSHESILHVAMQAFEKQFNIHNEIEKVLHEMETNYKDSLVDKLARLQEEFGMLDGYTIQSQTEEILEGLGFNTADLQRPLKTFSGGWRMRVMLAKILLQKPSLLLLDEPTNHLDLPSIEWVEGYLRDYEGAVIIVSHDREFLNNCVNMTVEVSNYKLTPYAGNYEFYLEEKALRQEIQKGAFENQQAQIRQTERFIERFKAKASKARQVQSRVKMLDRIDRIDDVIDENAKVFFKFNFSTQPGRTILKMDHVSKSFGELTILKDASALIERGDKIALIGANGKGKSTVLRIISGSEPIEGERETGYNVIPSFFAQHQLESLKLDNEILEELKQAGSGKLEIELRTILGCFLFKGDDVFKKIKVLSGGEKSRVALAKTLISESNFLLLDEPTNHLDIQSVNILIQALQQYEGTFITVSHDRHFVASVATKIWYIEDHQIKVYPGTYDEYEYWKSTVKTAHHSEKKDDKPVVTKPSNNVTPADNDKAKEQDKKLKTANQKLEKIESEIMDFETKKNMLEEQMSNQEQMSDSEKYKSITTEYNKVKKLLDEKQYEWDLIAEEISVLENG
ncbi:MAG: ABC-F family ATP-binding cassette domain-containing protein [Bacteroidota bacterium]|nr:ABC-F family ATP-binding cassette domain-containing protein [Bacteroidota bacterium]